QIKTALVQGTTRARDAAGADRRARGGAARSERARRGTRVLHGRPRRDYRDARAARRAQPRARPNVCALGRAGVAIHRRALLGLAVRAHHHSLLPHHHPALTATHKPAPSSVPTPTSAVMLDVKYG